MYKDLISYKLKEGVSEEHLLNIASKIIDSWMKRLPGFINWEIHKHVGKEYIDIVYWENEAAAKNAEKEMSNIPNASDWYGCYEPGSIQGKRLFLVRSFQ